MENLKPCLFCEKLLESIMPDSWESMQPTDGGEVHFIFSYGSKFDNCPGITKFKALICDDCAEKYIDKMKESRNYDN